MGLSVDFSTYTQWLAYITLACMVLALLGFIFQWGIRFRLVGVTGFMIVLTVGCFALSLGLLTRTLIPGAVRFEVVYDNGANQTVISVPNTISESELTATLQQAANDLFSYGRTGLGGDGRMTVRARTLVHPETGITKPLYLGQVRRSLSQREDSLLDIEIFPENLAQLPKAAS
jgi:hypothetical protein